MYGDIQPVPFTLTNEEFGEKGDMGMKKQYENNGKTFWEDIDSELYIFFSLFKIVSD
jgi:hypothetical protein